VVGGGKTTDIWTYDIARNTFSRLTFDGNNRGPVWSPDGKAVTYWSMQGPKHSGLYVKPADGSGEARLLLASTQLMLPTSWSPDGKFLAVDHVTSTSQSDVWVLSVDGNPTEVPFVQTKFDEWEAAFSPDGRWVAYVSDESGRYEIYVKPFPEPGGKWQVSTSGGTEPLWSGDGRELFYNNGDKMMAVKVDTDSGFKPGTPQVLFSGFYNPHVGDQAYGVAPGGQRFLVIHPLRATSGNPQINVVVDWFAELRRLAPSGKN
jgi:Tol biopolymer transport system component